METTKILYFMPDMYIDTDAGSRSRVVSLLRFFKSKDFSVDYFGVDDWSYLPEKAEEKLLATKLVDNVFVGQRKPYKKERLKRFFFHKLPEMFCNRKHDNSVFRSEASLYLCKQFDKVLKENEYDYIIVNYTYWADIIRDSKNLKGAKTIIDTHDFITFQQYNRDRDKYRNSLGQIFQEEINRLNYFDEVWAVSVDEYHVFSQLLDVSVKLVPNISLYEQSNITNTEKKYDLFYVASDNPYNKKSAKWFFNNVYPLLDKTISIKVVGKICKHLEDYPNVDKEEFVEDLTELYSQSRVAICPMLEGTGIKLKVLEAMSFGLPVVCTERGVDGLPNKINNGCLVADSPNEFADCINLLLSNENKYNELQEESKKLYTSYFLLEKRIEQLENLFSRHIKE